MDSSVTYPKDSGAKTRPPAITPDTGKARQYTEIEFAYYDLDKAMEVPLAMVQNGGATGCSTAQLAVWMNTGVNTGSFRMRCASAAMYKFVETSPNRLELTPLGAAVIDPATEHEAKVEAFLNVPLFRRTYEEFEGKELPDKKSLERAFESWGVPPKQTNSARWALERSARIAGFFRHGGNRLVKPEFVRATAGSAPPYVHRHVAEAIVGSGSRVVVGQNEWERLDPILQALLRRLPNPESGWDAETFVRWLRTFAVNLELVYPTGADLQIIDKAKGGTNS